MSNRGGLSNAFSHLDPQERNGSRHSQISERDTLQSASLIARAEGKMNTTTTPDLFKTGRTLLIEFKDDGSTTQNHLLFTVDIKGSFSPANNTSPRKVLYLLEGPHPDHVTTLEEHFKIQQSFFMKHKRSSERGGDHRAKETPLLPSLIDPQKTWCLDYHALRLFDNNWTSNSVRCAENERHLELSRINGGLDETGIIGQKASYWLKNYDNGGWEAAIVLNREALKEANSSILEAQSVRVLTVLGMLFLSLSFARSLLNMAKDYLPGAEKFWVYFSIAGPLILFVVFLAVVVSLGGFSGGRGIGRRILVLRKGVK
ncbi:hypothetical protein EJ08DRAFT_731078 [Tothia fuscella]|uniref:Uncharacterized protein n=1 Tax=Tothia fuscella TaxID=1048955 RepID=A0A9P4U2F9_9PEZI|nr:hypothetical protein EJ08DRAFT_731078 [Tothia fuscella]